MTRATIDYMNTTFTYQEGFRDGATYGEAQGYRDALWHMAVALNVTCYLAQCAEHSMAEVWYGWLRNKALIALRDLGDEQAAQILQEVAR